MEFHIDINGLAPQAREEILTVLQQIQTNEENGNSIEANTAKEKLADLLNLYGLHEESRRYYMELEEEMPSLIGRPRLLRKISSSYSAQRQHLLAQPIAEEALAMLHKGGKDEIDIADLFETLIACAFANYFISNTNRLKELIKELKVHFPSISDQSLKLRFYFVIIQDMLLRHRFYMLPEESITHAEFYLHLALETGNWNTIASAYSILGFVHIWREELALARKQFEEACELLQNRNMEFVLTNEVYTTISYRMENNITMTEKWAHTGITAAKKSQNELYLAVSYGNLAWVYAKRDNWPSAENYARKAIGIFITYKYPMAYLCVFPLLASLYNTARYEEAGMYCYLLLHPRTKRLPDTLNEALEKVNFAWCVNCTEHLKACLNDLIREAQLTNYF